MTRQTCGPDPTAVVSREEPGPELGSMVDLLRRRAREQPCDRAYVFLGDRGREEAALTFAELERRASAVAARLAGQAAPGERAVLMFPPGVDFLVGYFGCLMAGIVAVPIMVPRRQSTREASASILADCTPRVALTTRALIGGARADLVERFAGLDWLAVDEVEDAVPASALPEPARDDIAFLQYTSGSTSAPKGVVVSHGNLLANLEMIRLACGNTRSSTYVSWVPLYHDLGLVLNALQSIYVGSTCVLMAPVTFMQRPITWLRAISDYRAEIAGGPNFAFDLCVERFRADQMAGIDLSGWKLAFSGAEPVRAESIERFTATFQPFGFAPQAFWPAYGMAEGTLLISANRRGSGPLTSEISRDALGEGRKSAPNGREDVHRIVACGRALPGERIAIVGPHSLDRLETGRVGEIWVAGPNVAQGYWRNPAATAETFAGRIAGESDGISWLRTGDLGVLDDGGQLYITGRLKDVIIIRGINHYPQDIELTAAESHPALRRNGCAAFTVPDEQGRERLVVVQEIERTARHEISVREIGGVIREAIATQHELSAFDIALIRPGTLPKTTSGKLQRALTRKLWSDGALDRL